MLADRDDITFLKTKSCLFVNLKVYDTDNTVREIISAPWRAARIIVNFPKTVIGTMSPYPTVVIVITVTYTALKN